MTNYLTYDIDALSLNDLRQKYPDLVYSSWFADEPFADVKAVPGRYELCFDYPNSRNLNYAEQSKLLSKNETVPDAAVVCQALIQHFQQTGKRLLSGSWSRTSSIDSVGDRVYVGDFDADGLRVNRDSDGDRLSFLGLSASRNFEPRKLEPSSTSLNSPKKAKKQPKFVQIAVTPAYGLYALDEDGGVWELRNTNRGDIWFPSTSERADG